MKYIKTYCPNCKRESTHVVWTKDGYGASGTARIFTSLLSFGTSNLVCTTYSKCISCGKTKQL